MKPWELHLIDCHERLVVAEGFFAMNLRAKGFEAIADAEISLRCAVHKHAPAVYVQSLRNMIGQLYEAKVSITFRERVA